MSHIVMLRRYCLKIVFFEVSLVHLKKYMPVSYTSAFNDRLAFCTFGCSLFALLPERVYLIRCVITSKDIN